MKNLVDLGCGKNKRKLPNYTTTGIDQYNDSEVDIVCRLGYERIPLADNFADYVSAIQLIEHIPRTSINNSCTVFNPFIELMNEIHRIAKDGALVEIHVPKPAHPEFWQDPTHVNGIVDNTWIYFGPEDTFNLKQAYGINCSFQVEKIIDEFWYKKYFLRSIKSSESLTIYKPYRESNRSILMKISRKIKRIYIWLRMI